MKNKNLINQNSLHKVALTTIFLGLLVSLCIMFNAGNSQKSILLIALFTFWVASPFSGLLIINSISNKWCTSLRKPLYWLMIILTIISIVAYSGVLKSLNNKPAFIFLIVPFFSWLSIATFFIIAKRKINNSKDIKIN